MRASRTIKIAASVAALGGLAAAIVAWRTPVEYVSTSVVRLRLADPPLDSSAAAFRAGDFLYSAFRDQDSLGYIVKKERLYEFHDGQFHSLNGRIHKMRLAMEIGPTGRRPPDGSFKFSFSDDDPSRAQRVLTELIAQMSKASGDMPGASFETVEPPTRPSTPSGVSRLSVTGAGVGIGLLAGAVAAKLVDLLLVWAARSSGINQTT